MQQYLECVIEKKSFKKALDFSDSSWKKNQPKKYDIYNFLTSYFNKKDFFFLLNFFEEKKFNFFTFYIFESQVLAKH